MELIETSGTHRVVTAMRVVQRIERQLVPFQPIDFERLSVLLNAIGIIPDIPLSVNELDNARVLFDAYIIDKSRWDEALQKWDVSNPGL